LGVFFPVDNASYSRVFGTHTKTAEVIQMPFGLMTRVGRRYHVLDGDPICQGKEAILGKNVAAHYKVMGHSTMRCTKTAKPIDIPFCLKIHVGPRNYELDGVLIPQGEEAIFEGCPGNSKALTIFNA